MRKIRKHTVSILFLSLAIIALSRKYNSFVAGKNSTMNYVRMITDISNEEKLAEFTTKFNKKSFGRAENIRLAAKAIDEQKIAPGQTFSFNDTVGPTDKKNGYKMAQIFVKGKKEKGYGGGSCQVSSTLYNAVLAANLKVTERHAHSKKVYYVGEDKDAATSYGGIDFKFVNDKDYTVKINSYIYGDTLTVALYKSP